ncbi:MAG: putative DNA binding domain-containing protein [Candidatus Kapabacteria bacterium]|jgi:ATP-dependent DNA helicase RecG|nr:putative DNA binding domain-containing protein [Candidatus Kapabacteria bacterium]
MKTAQELLEELNLLDETEHIEAKEASGGLGKSFWETVCAFANEPGLGGGYIVLGVRANDEGTLFSRMYEAVGVQQSDTMLRDIATQAATVFNIPIRPQTSVEVVGDKKIIVAFIPEAQPTEKPVFIANRGLPQGAFRRIGSTDQRCQDDDLLIFYQSRSNASFDQTVLDDSSMADIDVGAVQEYRRIRAEVNPGAAELELSDEDLLKALRCIEPDAIGTLRPTVAGIVLFGSAMAQRRLLPTIRVDYMRMPGKEWISDPVYRFQSMEARGALLSVLRRIETAIWEDLGKAFYLPEESLISIETPIISRRIIREALTNALMHRSYHAQSSVQIIRYANRLEVRNPGFSLVSPDKLGEPGSVRRNPFIAEVLHDLNIAETKGTGIGTMRKLMREANLSLPFFDSKRDTNQFVATFFLHHFLTEQDWQWLGLFHSGNISSEEALALVYLREVGEIDNSSYRALNNVDTLDASKHLRRLRDIGILRQNEKGRSTYYTGGERFAEALAQWKSTNPDEQTSDPDEKSTNLDEKSTNLDEKSTNPDEKSTNPDEKSTNPDEKSTNPESKSTDLEDKYSELPIALREKLRGLSKRPNKEYFKQIILDLCAWKPLSTRFLAQYTDRTDHHILHNYLQPMIQEGLLKYTIPDKPNHAEQAYRTVQPISLTE